MRRLAPCVAAIAICALPAAAPAHTASFKTNVKIKDFVIPEAKRGDIGGSFFGRVKSKLGKCVKNRKVKVFRKQPGDDILEGKATSDGKGRWAVPVKLAGSGTYYAMAKRRVLGSGAHTHVCKGARSLNFVFKL